MKYSELSTPWKRIFELEWESLQKGSKAIAAVIVNEEGEIVSEGRNQIAEWLIPNTIVAHAEAEAVRNLNLRRHRHPKTYTLYTGLEPCIMCMGTIVMGHIRKVVIAARDDYGGAMHLINHSDFAKSKGMQVTFLDNELGDMQRAFQTLREMMYNNDEEKKAQMLADFSVYNKTGVDAAVHLMKDGFFEARSLEEITAEVVFDALIERFT